MGAIALIFGFYSVVFYGVCTFYCDKFLSFYFIFYVVIRFDEVGQV